MTWTLSRFKVLARRSRPAISSCRCLARQDRTNTGSGLLGSSHKVAASGDVSCLAYMMNASRMCRVGEGVGASPFVGLGSTNGQSHTLLQWRWVGETSVLPHTLAKGEGHFSHLIYCMTCKLWYSRFVNFRIRGRFGFESKS